jgi:hypothetical protein
MSYSNVAEPPKLYGTHVPTIIFQTSDSYTCKPDNSGSLSGVLGKNPNHPHFTTHIGSTNELLQYYNV